MNIHVYLSAWLAYASLSAVSMTFAADPGSPVPQKPLPKDAIEQLESLGKMQDAIDDLRTLSERMSRTKYTACVKAFGSSDFCSCIKEQTPIGIDFAGYVQIVTSTRDELRYSEQDEDTKKMIDNTLQARELCVQKVMK